MTQPTLYSNNIGREVPLSDLRAFVAESNRIEGMIREPTEAEVEAHRLFLALHEPTVRDLQNFVGVAQPRARLREEPGMNVIVGTHRPPPGGPEVRANLEMLLRGIRNGTGPYEAHARYETLHPFMDGNGRSGRALWLWQMLREGKDPHVLARGFLHTWYYQSLSEKSRGMG